MTMRSEPKLMRLTAAMFLALSASCALSAAKAEDHVLAPTEITEWKAVYGTVKARDEVPARARLGGIITELNVTEGDTVQAGDTIGIVVDEKIAFQIAALDAQMAAYESQLKTAESDLARAEQLVKQGVVTKQRLDQLNTQADVVRNQLATAQANRKVLEQQQTEGGILAPVSGKVLTVPATKGAVILPGEPVATIGGGGFFLRLALPERFADSLVEGSAIHITTAGGAKEGKLAKIYPQISGGRVSADVEVPDLDTAFIDARVLVEVPVGKRDALLVPQSAVETRGGLDFVTVDSGDGPVERVVVTGRTVTPEAASAPMIEIMSGLSEGDKVVLQ